jgi:hypothetical protein
MELNSNKQLECEKCGCTNIGVIKKGFSGVNAVLSFVICSVTAGIFYYLALELTPGSMLFYLLLAIAGALPVCSFFYGTVSMDDVSAICMNCGNQKAIRTTSKPQQFFTDKPVEEPVAD